jgi:hypothetical protein
MDTTCIGGNTVVCVFNLCLRHTPTYGTPHHYSMLIRVQMFNDDMSNDSPALVVVWAWHHLRFDDIVPAAGQ